MLDLVSLKEFGYNFLGPILGSFTSNVYRQLKKQPKSTVYHLAREGYALKKAFDIHSESKNYDSHYLYASRTFLFRITLDLKESWELSVNHSFEGTLKDFFIARYAFSSEEVDEILKDVEGVSKVKLPADNKIIFEILEQKKALISSLVENSRKCYLQYLDKINFTGKETLPVVLDIGYSGTIQKLLALLANKHVEGIYMVTTRSGRGRIGNATYHISHCFKTSVKMGSGYILLDRSMFLESLLTAPDGQFVDILPGVEQDKFNFCFGKRNHNQENFYKLDYLLSGALQCISDMQINNVEFSTEEIEKLFEMYVTHRNLLPRASWPLFILDDAISGQGDLNPLDFFGL